jgi:hypothetical protein
LRFLFLLALGPEEKVRGGVGEAFLLEAKEVVCIVGKDCPKAGWKIAVGRARKLAAAAGTFL